MPKPRRAPQGARKIGYLAAIVVNAILWVVLRNLQRWDMPFVVWRLFPKVVPAVDLSLVASMVASALYLLFDPPWFGRLGQAITNATSLYSMCVVYTVFPFDSGSEGTNQIVRVLMLLGMVAAGIGAIVGLARLPSGRDH